MNATSLGTAILVALVLLSAGGCSSQPPLGKVSGRVMLDGEPLPDVVVEFLPDPDQGTHGPRSTGTTDASGRFHLVCDDQREGAIVGFHRVLIQDARLFPPPRGKDGQSPVFPAPRISERYRRATETPLRQEVKAEPQQVVVEVTKGK